jgi:chemotaxis protein MotB
METIVRKKTGEEGDSYLASLSDLMVGMLFVFIIMLMAFALSYRSAQEQSNRTIDESQRMLDQAQRERAELQLGIAQLTAVQSILTENDALRRQMLKEIQEALARRGVPVLVDPAAGVLRLGDRLLFESAEAVLREDGMQNVVRLSAVLAEIVPCYARSDQRPASCPPRSRPILEAVYIEGHTDDRPIRGRFASNWELSTQRAVNTYQEMRRAEPELLAMKNLERKPLFGVSGYGEERPVGDNSTNEGRAANRRIDIRFVLATPSAEQLQRLRTEIERRL